MNKTFTDNARRCWALAARVLGWGPGAFWSATPAELVAALSDPSEARPEAFATRETIMRLMERDADG
ncbi:MAG: phage tail assembly chaperone [Porphyrobacter sp.]|nr:phage tail assembly chaperone [Porphyrobacter sp.]